MSLKGCMDFINKVKLPISYYAFNDNWDLLDRDDKADIIMRYIDDVELEIKNGKLVVKQINFRSTFYNDFNSFSNSCFGLSNLDFKTGKKNSFTTLSYSKISDSNTLTESSIVSSLILFLQSSHL